MRRKEENINLKILAIAVLGTMLLTIGAYRIIEANRPIKPCVNVSYTSPEIMPNMPREGQEGGGEQE